MSLLGEQQSVHKNVMQEALMILEETEDTTEDSSSPSTSMEQSVHTSIPEPVKSDSALNVQENGSSPTAHKSRKPRKRSIRRPRRIRNSTQTPTVSPHG